MSKDNNCTICGEPIYGLSYGGAGICSACDCYGCCKRCKILIAQNRRLKDELTNHKSK